MLHPNFVIVGTLIGAIGSISYLIDTVRGKVKPNRVSFLLWSIAPMVIFFAQIQQKVGMEALMTFSNGLFPLLILAASFTNKKAEWKLSNFDLVCGGLSVLGLVLWMITKVGNVAILMSVLADGLAAVPTIRKAFSYPETEIAWPWFATAVGGVLSLLTIEHFTFANSAFLVYLVLVCSTIAALTKFKIGQFFHPPAPQDNGL